MPADMKRYLPDWKAIRARILERDGHKCRWCGAANYEPHPITGSKVVLTIMHWPDHNPANCTDDNLSSACQKCHNGMDAPHRAINAAATRRRKREQRSGQIPLIG